MKAALLGAVAIAVLAVCGPAMAADSSAYMNQCKANASSGNLPPNMKPQDAIDRCQCMVDTIGDNQAAVDELTQFSARMAKMTPDQRRAEFQNGPPKFSKPVADAFQACYPPPPAGAAPPK